MICRCFGVVLATVLLGGSAVAQVKQRFDLRIPMRDGVELSGALWTPEGPGPYPTVVLREPDIKASFGNARRGRAYAARGYAFLAQDSRGRGDSDGKFSFLSGEGGDGLDAYPPREVEPRSLYLTSGGRATTLSGDGRLTGTVPSNGPPDRYTYDPKRPVSSRRFEEGKDQTGVQRRDDVLVYTGDVLSEPIEIIGPVDVALHAATDARDTDFTAKITDVHPDVRAFSLGPRPAGVIRARYRKGFEREILVTPGAVEEYPIRIGHLGHAFLAGHRIRIEISSSATPFINPNQNTGNPVATDTEWRVATQTIYHDRARPSRVVLPVMPK